MRLPQNCLRGPVPASLPANPTTNSYYLNRLAEIRRKLETMDDGPIVFLGDSLSSRADWTMVCRYPANAAITGERVTGILASIGSDLSPILMRSTAVHLHAGLNDLRACVPVATIQAQIADLMRWISGPLVVTLVTYQGMTEWQAETTAVNDTIRAEAAAHRQCAVVDLNPVLAPGGTLLEEFNWDGDGFHYNKAACRIWYPMVRRAFAEIGVAGFARNAYAAPQPLVLS